MKPWTTIATAHQPEGEDLVLQLRGGEFAIRVGGKMLMSSANHGSEEHLAMIGLEGGLGAAPAVLIGGLGMGYTLKAALKRLPPAASVVVAEISEAVVDWNRGPLREVAGAPLDDPRTSVHVVHVGALIASAPSEFDLILLDVDNGPVEVSHAGNQQLYGMGGLAACKKALRPGGRLVVWSAGPDDRFLERMKKAGFHATEKRVPVRRGANARHSIFVGELATPAQPATR
jgi:spermidine synthase